MMKNNTDYKETSEYLSKDKEIVLKRLYDSFSLLTPFIQKRVFLFYSFVIFSDLFCSCLFIYFIVNKYVNASPSFDGNGFKADASYYSDIYSQIALYVGILFLGWKTLYAIFFLVKTWKTQYIILRVGLFICLISPIIGSIILAYTALKLYKAIQFERNSEVN